MCSPRRLIVMGVSSDSGRNPIGQRTESDRTANGIQSGGGRNPTGRRTQSDRKTLRNRNNIAAGHTVMSSGYTLLYIVPSRGCTCLKCTNRAKVIQHRFVGALETSAPPEFTLRSSCLQRRRCPCQVLRRRCRDSDRRCCRCGCLSPYWLR